MQNRIDKKSLNYLLGLDKKVSRREISEIFGITDSLARTYKGILDNIDLLSVPDKEENKDSCNWRHTRAIFS